MRADAERNRRSILEAAERIFALEGTDVSLERVAAEAGVGVGTIYRRFPRMEDLRNVVFEEQMSLYADRTEQAAQEALEHPWKAFESWVFFILDEQARSRAFSDALLSPRANTPAFRGHMQRALTASEILVELVQRAGVVRDGFDHTDLRLLQLASSGIASHAGRPARVAARRFGQYMLDAFRVQGELPVSPAPWTRARAAR